MPKDDAKYNEFSSFIGDWEVIAYRVFNYNPVKAREALLKVPKEWIAEAFATKMMFD